MNSIRIIKSNVLQCERSNLDLKNIITFVFVLLIFEFKIVATLNFKY